MRLLVCGVGIAVLVLALTQAAPPALAQHQGGDAAQGVPSTEDRLERRQETLERLRQHREKAREQTQDRRDGAQEQPDGGGSQKTMRRTNGN